MKSLSKSRNGLGPWDISSETKKKPGSIDEIQQAGMLEQLNMIKFGK